MNRISTYIKSLLPSFETSRVKEALNTLQDEIESLIVPMIEKLRPIFPANWRWRNKDAKYMAEFIQAQIKISKLPHGSNAVAILEYIFKNMLVTLPFLKAEVDKAFGREITNSGLTFSKANLLQYSEVADFFVKFSQTFINFLTSAELNSVDGSQKLSGVAPGDLEWLKANLHTFVIGARIMALDVNQLKTDMHAIPDMLVDESTEEEAKVLVGHGTLDPFGFAQLSWPMSWIYHRGLRKAEQQIDQYERTKAEAKSVEYRILLLKQRIEEGTTDASTERLLEVSEDRLMKLRFKISKAEADYGIA